jgi:hypothetical protein
MDEGGERGKLTVELAATLAKTCLIMTPTEQREPRELLVATTSTRSPGLTEAVNLASSEGSQWGA